MLRVLKHTIEGNEKSKYFSSEKWTAQIHHLPWKPYYARQKLSGKKQLMVMQFVSWLLFSKAEYMDQLLPFYDRLWFPGFIVKKLEFIIFIILGI